MLHLEFLADYFSEPLVGGFLFGATFHILIQQFDAAIGVKKPKSSGLGHLFIVSFLWGVFQILHFFEILNSIVSPKFFCFFQNFNSIFLRPNAPLLSGPFQHLYSDTVGQFDQLRHLRLLSSISHLFQSHFASAVRESG